MYREWMSKQAKKAAKHEKKMKVMLAGYQASVLPVKPPYWSHL